MKKILFLVALVAGVNVYAQPITPSITEMQSFAMTITNAAGTAGRDTTVAGGADTTFLKFTMNGATDFIASATFTKISGTVGGSALFQGSVNNSTWYTLKSDESQLISGQFTEDTATLANATTTYVWNYPNHEFKYYRIRFITTDGAAAPTGTVYYRRNDD
jgi:hypothetical protein